MLTLHSVQSQARRLLATYGPDSAMHYRLVLTVEAWAAVVIACWEQCCAANHEMPVMGDLLWHKVRVAEPDEDMGEMDMRLEPLDVGGKR